MQNRYSRLHLYHDGITRNIHRMELIETLVNKKLTEGEREVDNNKRLRKTKEMLRGFRGLSKTTEREEVKELATCKF